MRKMIEFFIGKHLLCAGLVIMALFLLSCTGRNSSNSPGQSGITLTQSGAGSGTIDNSALGDGLFARIITNRGDIIVNLEYQKTPLTVCNFVALAEGTMTAAGGRPFYNGITFHRVIDDFMIQAGCPLGNGTGGPGYRFADEIDPNLRHDGPGVLSMANAGPGTNGSQFFITHVATPWLDGRHTVFGRVVHGQNVVNAVRQGDRIDRIAIIRNGAEANAFRADQVAFDSLLRNAESAELARILVQRDVDIAQIEQRFPNTNITLSGLRWVRDRAGTGPKPSPGSTAVVNIIGMLLTGTVFVNTDLTGGAEELPVGSGRILPGLDEAILDMSVGEKRTVIVPPELGYGERAVENVIPANSFLIFEIELTGIK
jgi:peptidylprolyl isomerase